MPVSCIFSIVAWTSLMRLLFLIVPELVRTGLILIEFLTNISFDWPPLRVNIALVLTRGVVVTGEAVGLPADVLLKVEHDF